MLAEGYWMVRSKKDPRWNGEGTGLVGMFSKPQGAKDFVAKKKEELGTDPPDDLEFSYMKD